MTATVGVGAGDARSDELVGRLLRGCWPSLPALTLASVVVCLAAVVPLLAAPGVNAVSIVVAAVCVGPAFAGLVATVDAIAQDGQVDVRAAARAFRASARAGLRLALVPAVFAELFLAAWRLWREYGTVLLWPSLGLTGAATVLGTVAALAAVGSRPVLDGAADRVCWRVAAARLALRPDRYLAVAVVAGLGAWLLVSVSVALALLVPVPVAVVLVAATRTTALPGE